MDEDRIMHGIDMCNALLEYIARHPDNDLKIEVSGSTEAMEEILAIAKTWERDRFRLTRKIIQPEPRFR